MRRPVFLHGSVLNAVDRQRGLRLRDEFIAQAVAGECRRQALGGGVISGERDEAPRFTPKGLLSAPPGVSSHDLHSVPREWREVGGRDLDRTVGLSE